MRFLILIFSFSLGFTAHAMDMDSFNGKEFIIQQLPDLKDIPWKVGDFQERNLKKGSFKGGTLYSWVDREEGEAVWLINELKIIFKKKQVIEALIEKKTGKILRYIEDGEEKSPPDVTKLDECEELSEAKETVKVPAGTYKTTRTIAQCDEDIMALWVTDQGVNLGGHVRQAVLGDDADPKKPEYVVELVKFGNK